MGKPKFKSVDGPGDSTPKRLRMHWSAAGLRRLRSGNVEMTLLLPDGLNLVRCDHRITRYDGHGFGAGLGYDESVERIAVVIRQRVKLQQVTRVDRQYLEPIVRDAVGEDRL